MNLRQKIFSVGVQISLTTSASSLLANIDLPGCKVIDSFILSIGQVEFFSNINC